MGNTLGNFFGNTLGNFFVRRRLIREVNEATRKNTKPSKIAGLKQHDFQVTPTLVEVNFYETGADEREYKPEKSFSPLKHAQGGTNTSPDEFFKDPNVRRVALIGGAGYGKTEMTKKFSNDMMDEKIPGLEEVEVIQHMNFRDFHGDEKLTLGSLLLGNVNMAPSDRTKSIEWIASNPNKYLLVLDGADQYENIKDLGKNQGTSNYRDKMNPTDMLNGLLSGNLLPGIRVLYSSREHGIRSFGGSVRADKVIALSGFSYESVQILVKKLGGDDGDKIWNHLQEKAPALIPICTIPMFLVFTVLVVSRHKENPPKTFSEILLLVLRDMTVSEHVRAKEDIHKVIDALKITCFQATKKGQVTFTKKDLPEEITVEDIQDLIIIYPGTSGINQKLVEGNYKYILCHQSIQEALASLEVIDMTIEEFRKFLNVLHTPHWSMVRRITSGIILNDNTRTLVKGNDPSVSLLRTDFKILSSGAEKNSSQMTVTHIYQGPVNIEKKKHIVAAQYVESGASVSGPYKDVSFTAIAGTPTPLQFAKQDATPEQAKKENTDFLTLKQDALKKSFQEQFRNPELEQPDLLELLHSLHQCGDSAKEIVADSPMESINLNKLQLSAADFHVVFGATQFFKKVKSLRLGTINEEQLSDLKGFLAESRIAVNITTIKQTITDSGIFLNLLKVLAKYKKKMHFNAVQLNTLNEIHIPDLECVFENFDTTINANYVKLLDKKDSELLELLQKVYMFRNSFEGRIMDVGTLNIQHIHVLKSLLEDTNIAIRIHRLTVYSKKAKKIFTHLHKYGNRVQYDEIKEIEVVYDDDPDIIASVFRRCSKLQYLSYEESMESIVRNLQLLTISMKKSNIKISIMRIWSYGGLYPSLSREQSVAVCDCLPHVTDELEIDFFVKHAEIEMIQTKLNSLPPTNLQIKLLDYQTSKWISFSQKHRT
ncbi:uncharacterized protein LOC120346016 isoform X2 [Styela clava]